VGKSFSIPSFDLSKVMAEFFSMAGNYNPEKSSKSNLIDPFSASVEAALYKYSTKQQWLNTELQRTRQKNLMNHLGWLQQEIIGQLPGWKSYKSGQDMPDVVGIRGNQKFICEVKNKHNTMNKNATAETYDVMSEYLSRNKYLGYTGILVQIVAKTPKNVFWKPFNPPGRKLRQDMLVMNARVFYAFATDPEQRRPEIDVKSNSDITKWPSWHALDFMLEEFWDELERQTNFDTPSWIKQIAIDTL
jgi:hypothetical protein